MRRWASGREVERHLGVSRRTLYAWRARHGLPSYDVGGVVRYDMAEVDEWVAERRAVQPLRLVGRRTRRTA